MNKSITRNIIEGHYIPGSMVAGEPIYIMMPYVVNVR